MALPEKQKLPMYFGTDYKELYHDSKITLPQFPPTLCGTKSGFAPDMKSPASLKVICIEPQAWNWQKVQTCSWTKIYPVWRKRNTVKVLIRIVWFVRQVQNCMMSFLVF